MEILKTILLQLLVPDKDYAQQWAKDNHKEFDLKILNQRPRFYKNDERNNSES